MSNVSEVDRLLKRVATLETELREVRAEKEKIRALLRTTAQSLQHIQSLIAVSQSWRELERTERARGAVE